MLKPIGLLRALLVTQIVLNAVWQNEGNAQRCCISPLTLVHDRSLGDPLYDAAATAVKASATKWRRHSCERVARRQLGDQAVLYDAMKEGIVQLAYTRVSVAAGDFDPLKVLQLPFVFRDFNHWLHYVASDKFEEIAASYHAATGNYILDAAFDGNWQIVANQRIRILKDLQSIKVATPEAGGQLEGLGTIGVRAAAVKPDEFTLAYKYGGVDGFDANLSKNWELFNSQPSYINITRHVAENVLLIANGVFWDGLSGEDKTVIRREFRAADKKASIETAKKENEIISYLTTGTKFKVVEIDRGALRARAEREVAGRLRGVARG